MTLSFKPQTVSNTVYEALYKNIMNLTLKPGTPLSEKEVSQKLNVSRTPVREAFLQLSQNALINVIPQKGSFVTRINLSRVEEERFLRESLESSIIEDIIKNYDISSYKEDLTNNLTNQNKALQENDLERFIDLDDSFHRILFTISEKQTCHNLIMNFSSHYHRVRFLLLSLTKDKQNNIRHHNDLFQAIQRKDINAAHQILGIHLHQIVQQKEMLCSQYPDFFEITESSQSVFDEKLIFKTI